MAKNNNGKHILMIKKSPSELYYRPCIDVTLGSVAKCYSNRVLSVVMTGMGADGSEGISNLRPKKKCHVITQEQSTCAVYGMPRAAVTRGLSDEVEPLENLASAITKHVGVK